MKSAFFVSDVHLVDMASPNGEAMLSLVKRAQIEADLFVILGDLFDIWVGSGEAFQRRYARLIDGLRELRKDCRILYFEGNHDFHLNDFWERELNFEVHTGPKLIEHDGMKIWCEHGDEIDRDDRGYLFLRWLLRTPPAKLASRVVPSEVIALVGNNASHASRTYTSRKQNRSRDVFRRYAEALRDRHDFDLVVTGHTHLADDFTFTTAKGSARLINLGSWFDGPHFLKVTGKDKADIITL